MQVSQRIVCAFYTVLGTLFWGFSQAAPAARTAEALHWSGDQTEWDRKTDQVKLVGNATIHRRQETLVSDSALLDLRAREIHAKGNVYYATEHTIIQAEEIHFNLDSLVGTIIGARVTDGRFLLFGDRINRLSEDRYQTHNAEYTACRDCPSSWSLQGEDVDMEFGGYAVMSNVLAKIKDTPVLWAPFLIMPIKTERQTGLLFPTLGFSGNHGFTFVQPLFIAISRSVDATIGLGAYAARGVRAQGELRYASRNGSGVANFFHTMDRTASDLGSSRWALKLEQTEELMPHLLERVRINDVSDNRFPITFGDDLGSSDNPALMSDASLSQGGAFGVAFAEARVFRNLLYTESATAFDPNTVQLLPRVEIASRSFFLESVPIGVELRSGLSHFTRSAPSSDVDTVGSTPYGGAIVRKALRYHLSPRVSANLRPWDVLSLTPSLQYRGYFYSFFNNWTSLSRGYLLAQTELSLQLYKVYPTDSPTVPEVKHTVNPYVTYSLIPARFEPAHPFLDQVTANKTAFIFDSQDIVPIGTDQPSPINYFTPLGHSLSYGLNTQIIRKRRPMSASGPVMGSDSFQRSLDFNAGQTVNFLEVVKDPAARPVPFSRLFASLDVALDAFGWNTQYYFYPQVERLLPAQTWELSPHEVSTGLTYTIEKTAHQQILEYERSVSLGFSFRQLDSRANNLQTTLRYSISDYVMPSVTLSYDFLSAQFLTVSGSLLFQSPSHCWKILLSFNRNYGQTGFAFTPNFTINLTGASWGGVGEIAENVYSGSR